MKPLYLTALILGAMMSAGCQDQNTDYYFDKYMFYQDHIIRNTDEFINIADIAEYERSKKLDSCFKEHLRFQDSSNKYRDLYINSLKN